MYIYHVYINYLSSHIIHINLNMIFYTHVEHSPIKNNLRKVLYVNTHTHTHTHKCSETNQEVECALHCQQNLQFSILFLQESEQCNNYLLCRRVYFCYRPLWSQILQNPSQTSCLFPPDSDLPAEQLKQTETTKSGDNNDKAKMKDMDALKELPDHILPNSH